MYLFSCATTLCTLRLVVLEKSYIIFFEQKLQYISWRISLSLSLSLSVSLSPVLESFTVELLGACSVVLLAAFAVVLLGAEVFVISCFFSTTTFNACDGVASTMESVKMKSFNLGEGAIWLVEPWTGWKTDAKPDLTHMTPGGSICAHYGINPIHR